MTLVGYLLALTLTIFSEIAIVLLFGHKKKIILAVVLVNFISHPIFGFTLWTNSLLGIFSLNWFWIASFEIVIALVEAILLFYVFGNDWWKWLQLSFLMNAGSFLLGLAIFGITW